MNKSSGPKRENLIGKQFGKLFVFEFSHLNSTGGAFWKCKCTCGNEKIVRGDALKNGHTKSCGCLKEVKFPKRLNLLGKRFTKLVVIADFGKEHGRSLWLCRCDCGLTILVEGKLLTSKRYKSCGCLKFMGMKDVERYVKESNKLLKRKLGINKKFCRNRVDITGFKFGRLTVLKYYTTRRNTKNRGVVMWLCQCDCGKEKIVRGSDLKEGKIRSCGCLSTERKKSLRGKNNPMYGRTGEKSPAYVPPEKRRTTVKAQIRTCTKYRIWRLEVFKRDSYTCQLCGKIGGNLNADHIKPFYFIMNDYNITTLEQALLCSEFWDIDNGRTLCLECHKKTDSFGSKILQKKEKVK